MLRDMIQLMYLAHSGQYDKSGKPYFYHPLTVMQKLSIEDDELLMIAVGHDLFEDTTVTAESLAKAGFSTRVIDGITALTKQKGQSYEEYKTQVFQSKDAMLVKLADLEHNMDLTRLSTISYADLIRWEKYRKFRVEILEKLHV